MLLLNVLSLIDDGERPVWRLDQLPGQLHQQESGEVRRLEPGGGGVGGRRDGQREPVRKKR